MRKISAIALLYIYLFNIGGQLVLHQYFSYRAEKFYNEQAAKGLYNVNDLTEVKLPVNMPNITDWSNYEDVSGQINFKNTSYNYVKIKMTRNAIYLMCVPDYDNTQLNKQNVIDCDTNDVPVPKKEHVPFGKTIFAANFSVTFSQFVFTPFVRTLTPKLIHPVEKLAWHYPSIPEQPPKFSC